MHREYHPDDMQHLRAHAFEAVGAHDEHDHHHRDEHRRLYAFTAFLGALIGLDLLLWYAAPSGWRAPMGVRLIWVAALVGTARIVYQALGAMIKGHVGADVALAVASLAALALREPFVAAEVVFIAMVGEVLEAVTADRAMRSIRRLFDQAPRVARVRRGGQVVEVPPHEVEPGEVVVVAAGERIPVDGSIVAGRSSIDQSALTGESIPVDRGPGEDVFTGTINQFGRIEVRADRVGHESTFGQVLKLVADAQRRKAPLHRTADRLARYFLPFVFAAAGLTVAAGMLLGWPDTGERAVAVLVVACPCALILATPAAVMASMAWLARHGVVIKGGAALERLARCDAIAFDKTGTLTLGRPELATVEPIDGRSVEDLLTIAASAERGGRHPLAEAVVRAAEARGLAVPEAIEVVAMPGAGVEARLAGADGADRAVLVGNHRLMVDRGVAIDPAVEEALARLDAGGETPLLVAEGGRVVGLIGAKDTVRREAHDVVHDLKHLRFGHVALLTGDRRPAAEVVAKRVHIKTVEAELLPADKAAWIRARQAEGRRVAMVGDGINDAPALAAADVGIAIAGAGADLAAEAGDVVLMGAPLAVLPDFVKLSRATVRVIRQNIIIFAFGLNAAAIGLAFAGVLGPVAAAILHQAGSLLVLLNAMRLLGFGDWHEAPPFRQIRAIGRAIDAWDDRVDLGSAWDGVSRRWRVLLAGAAAMGALAYAGSGLTAIGPGEVGLVRRLGRFEGAIGPGLHLRWPRPIERVDRLDPDRVRGVTVGFRPVGERVDPRGGFRWESGHDRADAVAGEEALVMTGDGRLVELMATVQYRPGRSPRDLRTFAFGVDGAEEALRSMAEASVRSVVGRRPLDVLMTAGRGEAEREAADELGRLVSGAGLGVEVIDVTFRDAHPPRPVVDAYRDVSRADRDAQARVNEALAYRAERLAEARGQAAATRAAAEADRRAVVASADARADAFRALHSARASAPKITDHRLYADAVEAAVADRPKLILDPSRSDRRRHLILSGTDPAGWPGGTMAIPGVLGPPPETPAEGRTGTGGPNP